MTNNNLSHRVIESGKDPRKLGRWTWLKLQGKNGINIRVITIYRPVFSNGPTSTYQQQQTELLVELILTVIQELNFLLI
jgi:hypothetical protein